MSAIPVSDNLRRVFDDASAGQDTRLRAILVQNSGSALDLVKTAPPVDSDRQDFEQVLSNLFGDDPNRSGYALFRLDSQAASGEWEWICCAYQPDAAKIKEKMQYALTRSSLMAGLTERRFLDTIFGSTPRDFNWPTKLRNSRKHDYQNPQLKTAGVSAADAAGTGSGGARRNFGSRAGLANMMRAAGDSGDDSTRAPVEPSGNDHGGGSLDTAETRAPAGASPEDDTDSATKVTPMPQPKRFNSHALTDAFRDPGLEEKKPLEEEPRAAQGDDTAVKRAHLDESLAVEAPATPSVAVGQEDSLSQPTVPSSGLVSASVAAQESEESEQPESEQIRRHEEKAEAKNPSQPSTPKRQDSIEALSQPTVPSSLYVESQDLTTAPANSESDVGAAVPKEAPSRPKTDTRVGYGTGPSSGLTRREEELLELRKMQAAERSIQPRAGNGGGSGHGGPEVGFRWADGVSEAIQGLASTASGTSEWNLVVLSIDVANEVVELDEPPCFVPPADLEKKWGSEPRMAFYRFQDGQGGHGGESKVVMLYYCPAGSGVKARMMYSSNVLNTFNHVKGMAGLRVVKRIESSDPADLNHSSVLGEVEEVLAKERHIYAGTALGDSVEAGGDGMLPKEELKGAFAKPRKAGTPARR